MNLNKNKIQILVAFTVLLMMLPSISAATIQEESEAKEEGIVDAEGIRQWNTEEQAYKVLDIRAVAEFQFTGHPTGAVNIPMMFWDPIQKWTANEKFLDEIKKSFKEKDYLVLM